MTFADRFAEQTRSVERAFISAAWLDPIGGSNAGYDAGLCGRHFAYGECSGTYFYTCRCAELGTTPDLRQCVRAMRQIGEPLNWSDRVAECELFEMVMSYKRSSGALDDLAEQIVYLRARRERLSDLTRQLESEYENASDVINQVLTRVQRKSSNDGPRRQASRRSLPYPTFRRANQPG